MAHFCAFVVLAAATAAGALRDVPKGYCHDCEVTCFEDCAFKYDREVITPDLTDTKRLSRDETRVETEMKRKISGSGYALLARNNKTELHVEQARPTKTKTAALVKSYGSCLEAEQCPCNHGTESKGLQLITRRANKTRCAVGEKRCAVGCVDKAFESTSLLQGSQSVRPGPKESAAIPWSINVHPVKINTFSTGRQNLEQCFKSCLAATCGCEDAPGMEAIDDVRAALMKNHQAKDPVEDTAPMPQYRKAVIEECAKGMPGKKVTSGLYANFGGGPDGWAEVCSTKFFEDMSKAADVEGKNCASSAALLAGCLWDETMGECVYGMKKTMRCYTRYFRDTTP